MPSPDWFRPGRDRRYLSRGAGLLSNLGLRAASRGGVKFPGTESTKLDSLTEEYTTPASGSPFLSQYFIVLTSGLARTWGVIPSMNPLVFLSRRSFCFPT